MLYSVPAPSTALSSHVHREHADGQPNIMRAFSTFSVQRMWLADLPALASRYQPYRRKANHYNLRVRDLERGTEAMVPYVQSQEDASLRESLLATARYRSDAFARYADEPMWS